VTVSIGIAVSPDDATLLSTFFASADLRLSEAKSGGRNRVVGRVAEVVQSAL
jgi:GGDEF domain-containing protein